MDISSQTLQLLEYLLLLAVLVVLWGKALRRRETRGFWLLLAPAWTMNLLGNIAWIIHDLVTGTALDTLSAVDLFYILRYVLIGAALWLNPTMLTRRDGMKMIAAVMVAGAVVWAIYFQPAMALRGGDWTGFLGLAMYPALDAALITLAWVRLRVSRESSWKGVFLFLFCAMASYGIANTLNLTSYVFSVMLDGMLQNIFWVLTDIFMLLTALNGRDV